MTFLPDATLARTSCCVYLDVSLISDENIVSEAISHATFPR